MRSTASRLRALWGLTPTTLDYLVGRGLLSSIALFSRQGTINKKSIYPTVFTIPIKTSVLKDAFHKERFHVWALLNTFKV